MEEFIVIRNGTDHGRIKADSLEKANDKLFAMYGSRKYYAIPLDEWYDEEDEWYDEEDDDMYNESSKKFDANLSTTGKLRATRTGKDVKHLADDKYNKKSNGGKKFNPNLSDKKVKVVKPNKSSKGETEANLADDKKKYKKDTVTKRKTDGNLAHIKKFEAFDGDFDSPEFDEFVDNQIIDRTDDFTEDFYKSVEFDNDGRGDLDELDFECQEFCDKMMRMGYTKEDIINCIENC